MSDPMRGPKTLRDWPFIGGQALPAATDIVPPEGLSRGIYVATAGNLQCVMQDGSTLTFTGLLVGMVYLIAVRSIVGAGTTITGNILF